MERRDTALYAPGFFRVEVLVSFGKKLLDPFTISAINRNADAGGELGLFLVLGHDDPNAVGDLVRFFVLRLRQNESELIAPVARGGIDGTAMNAQDGGEAAQGAAANEMAEAIIDFFQAVEIEKQNGEGPAGAIGALGFILEDVEETAIVGEASERVADGEMADLFKQARVIEKRAAESERVAAHGKDLRENKGSVKKTLRLAGRKLSGTVHPSSGVDGAVEGRIFGFKAAPIPDHCR